MPYHIFNAPEMIHEMKENVAHYPAYFKNENQVAIHIQEVFETEVPITLGGIHLGKQLSNKYRWCGL